MRMPPLFWSNVWGSPLKMTIQFKKNLGIQPPPFTLSVRTQSEVYIYIQIHILRYRFQAILRKSSNVGINNLYPIGSMYAIYGNMDPINIPPVMLAYIYIPAPWNLWVYEPSHGFGGLVPTVPMIPAERQDFFGRRRQGLQTEISDRARLARAMLLAFGVCCSDG